MEEVRDERRGFYWIDHDVLLHHGRALGPYGITVYNVLAEHADQARQAWPSTRRMATLTGMSRSQVHKSLLTLTKLKLLKIERVRGKNGVFDRNIYTILEVHPRQLALLQGEMRVVRGADQGGPSQRHGVVRGADRGGPPGSPEQEPENKNQKNKKGLTLRASQAPYPEHFERWYQDYPLKRGKRAALKAWEETRTERPPLTQMLGALAWQRRLPDWTKSGGSFVPRPSTYLRAGSWEDEPPRDVRERLQREGQTGRSQPPGRRSPQAQLPPGGDEEAIRAEIAALPRTPAGVIDLAALNRNQRDGGGDGGDQHKPVGDARDTGSRRVPRAGSGSDTSDGADAGVEPRDQDGAGASSPGLVGHPEQDATGGRR